MKFVLLICSTLLLSGCLRCPDSIGIEPLMIIDKEKDITTVTDVMNSLKGAILNIKWKEDSKRTICSILENE
jgi:hypothetical protein